MAQHTEEAEVILKVNSKEAQEKFEKLEKQAKELRTQFAEAFKRGDTRGVTEINKQLQKVNKEMNNMRVNAANIKAAMTRLNEASPRELQRTIKLINNELDSGRVKRGTKEWDEYVAKLKEVSTELRKVKDEMSIDNENEGFVDKIKDYINDWGFTAASATAAFAGMVISGKEAVKTYAEMEAEEANVRKFTGMTTEEVAKLNNEFKRMDTRTAREDLNKLAQEAGRLGKSSVESVNGFVKAADKLNVALDDLGDGATLTLSKLTGIFGDEQRYGTEQSLLKIGSVINELSQNCSASAPYLAEFSSRIGGIAAQSNMAITQVMAFAAVLDTQNLAVEASATAVGQLITKIYNEPAKIAKAAGLDVQKFAAMVRNDMNGALLMLFEHLNKFGGMENLAKIFDRMGTDGARAVPVLSALAGHVEELKSQQDAANEAFREGVSVTNEFNVQNNTVQAQLDKNKKKFTEMAVTLGEKLLPVMQYSISGTSMLMKVLNVLITFIAANLPTILGAAGAWLTYKSAITLTANETRILMLLEKAHAVMTATYRTAVLALTAAWSACTGNIRKANAAMRLLNATFKSSAVGLVVTLIGAAAGAMINYTRKVNDNIKAQRELRAERRRFAQEAADISAETRKHSADELTRLKNLYNAATNEALAREQRVKAAKDLLALYPTQLKNMSDEDIMLGKAKTSYEKLTDAIIKNAKAKAAAEKVLKNEAEILDLEDKLDNARDRYKRAEKERESIVSYNRIKNEETARSIQPATGASAQLGIIVGGKHIVKSTDDVDEELVETAKEIKTAKTNISILRKTTDRLVSKYGNEKNFIETVGAATPTDAGGTTVIPTLQPDEKELKRREKAEREAERKAKEALKKDLDERKSIFATAEADNLTLYVTGNRDYLEYCKERERLEQENIDKIIEIHEQHNKIDIAAYGAALKQKAELLKKHQEEARQLSLEELEKDRALTEDAIIKAFYDASGPDFQNLKLLNQMLFQADIEYLKKKAELFLKGSQERLAIEKEIEKRIADDKIDKMKETSEALLTFEQKYRKSSGSVREKMEIDTLNSLHEKGLISEEEYQKALSDIKNKYLEEDKEKFQRTKSEYTDYIEDLYQSFTKLFSDLNLKGKEFWNNMSDAAGTAFAVMGAFLSQYSAYADAERDLELAKAEKRYDAEIKAAGKNEKKRTALEKQKEKEIASIKTKHNEKAMKIELAQAVSQTALAALQAYASAQHLPWPMSQIVGGIAAGLATAMGMTQIATIKKQHEAQAAGYYSGGFTDRDPDNRKEVGVVHANEFVANHQAVANPALSPVLRLIDEAQRNNTVGSLTVSDVSRAIGSGYGVGPGGDNRSTSRQSKELEAAIAVMAGVSSRTREAIDRLSDNLENGIEANVIMDGEQGLAKKLEHYNKLRKNPKR